MHRSTRILCATLLFLFVALSGSFAQERVAELKGTATDASGAVLPNVNVTLTNKATGRVFTAKTGTDGVYMLRTLDPGRYSARFELQGFTPLEFADMIIVTGKTLTLNADMKVGGTQQTVEVSADAPLIDTTTTAVGHNVTQEEFTALPKTRSFQSVANLAPSVNTGEVVEGGIQINGASGAENQFNVDGLSTNSLIEGQSRQNAMFEILEEVQVKTAGIEAQYGGAMGGVISAITRSGGNAFHGDVHYYFTGSRINAGSPKRLFMDPVDLKTVSYQQDAKQPNSAHEVGYSLGGYFIKDRLYFFSSASPRWQDREVTYLTADKPTPQRVTLTQDGTYWQAYNKISGDITRNLRANAAFLWTPFSTAGALPGYSGYGNYTTATASSLQLNQARGAFTTQSNYNASLDWSITPTTLFSIRAARFWDNYKALGVPNKSPIEWGEPSSNIVGLAPELRQAKGYSTIPRTSTNLYDITTRNTIQADFSKFLNFAGTHDFKVGIGRQRGLNKVDKSYGGGGYITLNWGKQLEVSPGVFVGGPYGYYQLDDIGTKGSVGGTMDNFFVQDRWRVIPRLSLDFGVRLEREVIPSFRRDIKEYAFEFGWGKKVAPRLGASFDVFGDGRVKVYGSWGRFFDWVKYELARGTFGGDVWRVYYRPITSLDTNYILGLGNGNLPGNNLWPTAFEDKRIPSFDSTQVDPNIDPMSSWVANAGVEYQINPKLMVSARYIHNSLRDTIEDIGTMINGSEYYIYGNPGKGLAKMSSPSGIVPAFELPRPKRVYDALELSFTRRFASRWLAGGSYVWSRLWGNYAGLQNSDEIMSGGTGRVSAPTQQNTGTTYRPGTSASRAYDLDYYMWDSHGTYDVTGRLGTDRPHVMKLYGSYTLPWKAGDTQIGGFFYAGSGTPVSTLVSDVQYVPLFVNGRGDRGRTPVLNYTDLQVSHEFKVREGKTLRIEFNANNLFNQKISRYNYSYYNRFRNRPSGINLFAIDWTKGYDWKALVDAKTDARDPLFGMEDNFNTGFSGRLGIKFTF